MSKKKTAVYAATRNIYKNVIPCLSSLLINGGIDEVVLLIEDDWARFRGENGKLP